MPLDWGICSEVYLIVLYQTLEKETEAERLTEESWKKAGNPSFCKI
jgi:hypothetical protein